MKKWLQTLSGAAGLLFWRPHASARTARPGCPDRHLQIAHRGWCRCDVPQDNDYTDRKNGGLTIWGDYDFTHLIGIEVEAHLAGSSHRTISVKTATSSAPG